MKQAQTELLLRFTKGQYRVGRIAVDALRPTHGRRAADALRPTHAADE